MNIRYLEIMEAVAETGTFTGAAKKLFITQSAVSHAVAELEAQAGTALFDRFPKGASLTRCGRTLLEESRSILTACRNLDRRISHLEENTPVSIVSSITIASSLLCRTLSRLRTSAPELKTFVRVTTSDNAVDILQRGEADIAFVEGAAPEGNFEIIPLGHYSLRAACAPDFPASRQVITLRQLCRYPLLLRERGSAVRDTLDHVLALSNLKAIPAWESINSASLLQAAEAGLGVTILPEKLLSESLRMNRLRLLNLGNRHLKNQMSALFYKDKYITGPLRILLDEIRSETAFHLS